MSILDNEGHDQMGLGNTPSRIEVAMLHAEIAWLRAALMRIRDVTGTSTEAHHIARRALEQSATEGK